MPKGMTRPPVAPPSRRFAAWIALVGALTVVAPAVTTAQEALVLPDSRLGVRTAPILLLTRPDVVADLGLDPSVATDASRLAADLRRRASGLLGASTEQVVAARRAVDEAQRRWIEDRLSEPQRRRLEQIDLQWEGPTALLTRSRVADALDLTPEQRAGLAQAAGARDAERIRGSAPRDGERVLAQKALAVLNDDQRQRWKAMLGTPFTPRPLVDSATQPASATLPAPKPVTPGAPARR